MVARYRVWMALGLGLLSASLTPGCRDFSGQGTGGGGQGAAPSGAGSAGDSGVIPSASGSGGAAGSTITGDSGADGESGSAGSGGGGAGASGSNLPAGGAGSGPEFSGSKVDLSRGTFYAANQQWTHLVPFVGAQGAPHFVAYDDLTGNVSFRRLEGGPAESSLVWSGQWEADITAFSRVTPNDNERLVLYWQDTGIRRLLAFKAELQGEVVMLETNLGNTFTHHASDIAPVGLPYLYWYRAATGELLVDMLDDEGTRAVGNFAGQLRTGYGALAVVGDRLLGFDIPNFDVISVPELSVHDEIVPIELTGLTDVERVVAFELGDIPMLFVYKVSGEARVIELAWTEDRARFKDLWEGKTLLDAVSVTGLSLPDEQLIFLHAPGTNGLEVIRITLEQ